ncbi:CDP-glycerol glycerophosphotransferase family protein [Halocynthiibacter namhaensis]|uniref:CDP-glycerol glycerophosphotransferase family protein n=1 Tax=Halocynthiibacter namhaensis TaxID=1290553 RepID=UPI00057983D2|nr:CDP-glycerol glycerophosphotransferase family protein [Halocynthiibacter namhaensis]
MLIATACLILLIALEAGARSFEAYTMRSSAISTVRSSDHHHLNGYICRVVAFCSAVISIVLTNLTGAPAWIPGLIAATFAIVRCMLMLLDKRRAQDSRKIRLQHVLNTPAFQLAPIAFFFSAPDLKTPDHITIWADEMDLIGVPWIAVVSEQHHLNALRKITKIRAALLSDVTDAPILKSPNRKLIFYANNGQKNRRIINSLPQLLHIQLLHGDSDKPPSYSPMTKNYDFVFVAGQMAIDRYARNHCYIPNERFRVVGRPQIRAIKHAQGTPRKDTKNIVYMPTWRGFTPDAQFSSLDRSAEVIKHVLAADDPIELHFKPHPMSYKDPNWPEFQRRILAALSNPGNTKSTGRMSLDAAPFDLFNIADALITDISSVMIDFLYSNKPFLVVLPKSFTSEQRLNTPSLEASYEVDAQLKSLNSKLFSALYDDAHANARSQFRSQAFGDLHMTPGTLFQKTCRDLLKLEPQSDEVIQ